MVDRLYENMLGLIRDSQEQYCNSTLCNLNVTPTVKFVLTARL